jgi:hypothetical protein
MPATKVQTTHVTATFYPESLELTFSTRLIPAEQGITRVVLQLETSPAATAPPATFAHQPVVFLQAGSGQPRRAAPDFLVQRNGDTEVVIWDCNRSLTLTSHPFLVVFEHAGEHYYSDPSIANQPPAGDPDQARDQGH